MSFTDEDLKRLKGFRLQGYHTWTAFEQNEIVDLVDALLSRLECAEDYALAWEDFEAGEEINEADVDALRKRWLASKGGAGK